MKARGREKAKGRLKVGLRVRVRVKVGARDRVGVRVRVGQGGGHAACPSWPHGTAVPVTGSRKTRRCFSFTWVGVG